jgi:hypothetical protein
MLLRARASFDAQSRARVGEKWRDDVSDRGKWNVNAPIVIARPEMNAQFQR